MDEHTFWGLLGRTGSDSAAYDRLADELSDHGAQDIRDFADHLARALYALDTPAHYHAAGRRFLDARCAAVAAGASAYHRVLREPAALNGYTDRPGTSLLPVAERAYLTSTRGAWVHTPPVSHERGSNRAAWGTHWLLPHMGTTTRDHQAPRAYMIALQHVLVTLDADPAWHAWWRRSGLLRCELGVVAEGRLDHLRPSADIRQIRDRVRANFTCSPPAYEGRPAALLPPAVDEVVAMFEVVRQAIGLPPLPAVPRLPDLPANACEVEVTTRALPSEAREQQDQGYVTLAQIQEFFG